MSSMLQNHQQDELEPPCRLAERLFGAATHTMLVSDQGPGAVFMGWRLGTGHAQSEERGRVSRLVDVEIYLDDRERYAVAERMEYNGASGERVLEATVTVLQSPEQVRAYCDAASLEPMREAALCAALDHVARFWPHLGRRRPNRPTPAFLRAALSTSRPRT